MTLGARCGFFVLLTWLATPALAQERPFGTWKDPPARDAGAPDTGAAAASDKDSGKTQAAPAAEAREDAAAPRKAARRSHASERRQARRSAAREHQAARRETVRTPIRTARPSWRTVRVSPRYRSSPYAVATSRFEADPDAFDEALPRSPVMRFRREGWGGLLSRRRTRAMAETDGHGSVVLLPRAHSWPPRYVLDDEDLAD